MISQDPFPVEFPDVDAVYFINANMAMFRMNGKVRTLFINADSIEIRCEGRSHEESVTIDQLDQLTNLMMTNIDCVRNIVFGVAF